MLSPLSRRVFLAAIAGAILTGPLLAAEPEAYWVFIGGYTGAKPTDGKGIYRCRFDPKTGTLGTPELAVEVTNPSFLAVHPQNTFLYAVGEVSTVGGKKAGGVHAFTLDAATGQLAKLNETDSGGPGPCHLSVNRSGSALAVANYGGGSVASYPLGAEGKIGAQASFFQHSGKVALEKRQGGPHAHSVNFSPDNRFAVVADLGMDKLFVYKHDAATGALMPNEPPAFVTPPGCGPRHFAWHPTGKFAYTNGEIDFNVLALSYDAATGAFTKLNSQPTLPADVPEDVRKKNSTAEVVVHPSGKYVFVSNRGHDSIATFQVRADGTLTAGPHLTGGLKVPRNFNVDPTGRWILVASQDGNDVKIFEWDNATGTGKPTGRSVAVGKPVCLKFVPIGK